MTGITVLGPVAVGDEGAALSPRDRVVLSVLVARRGREVPAETLAEALWGEALPASWHKVVQGCIARLRRRLGREAILTGRSGYRLAVPAEEVDAGRFERLVERARDLLSLEHADEAAYAADEALRLWRGHPLGDLDGWEPGRGEAQRLVEMRLQAEELRLGALLASGRHAEVLPEAALRVEEEPLRERRWALLARAQYQDRRQGDALATLRRAREVLAEELGLDPGAELVALEQAVLRQDPRLEVATAGIAAARCPWPGLASYDVEDADAFFGRTHELDESLDRLNRNGFLAVVGPSGSGKSSLVRAGLAARLRQQGRSVRVITPDPHPLDALAEVAAGRSRGLVLVVDQCEEIFSPSVPAAVRTRFLDGVAEQAWSGSTEVVLTLRADRLGELAAYPDIARLVEEGLYLLKAIGGDGLREAIQRPAQQAGLLLEQGLVDLLVRDVEGEPGSLPLLTHALRETWERRQGSTLTVEGYRASGGIRGAVAQSAERVYEAATEDQRHALRELLLRMVQSGPGGEPVRTSVPRDVVTDAEHVAVVEQLVRARLVTAEADRLDIAHEALAREWPRLQAWLADDREGERIRHHLAASARAWEAMGRPETELYRGARLAATREWRDTGVHRLTAVETEFLAASEAAHRSELVHAQAEARRQRRLNVRLRRLVSGAVVLALLAAVFGVVAGDQWRDAQAANEVADGEAARARSQELAAASVAAVGQDPALARVLAVLSTLQGAGPSPQTKDALHRAVAADRVVSRLTMSHRTDRLWAVLDPDGSQVAMTGENVFQPALALEVHDPRSGALAWEWARPETPEYGSVVVAGAQYSPDGSRLAGGVLWHPGSTVRLGGSLEEAARPPGGVLGVHLWDARTHEPLEVVDVGPCGGWPLALAGDSLLVRTLVPQPGADMDASEEQAWLRDCRWEEGAMATVLVDLSTGRSRQLVVTDALNLSLTVGHALTDDGSLAAVPDFATGSTVLVDASTGRAMGRLDNAVAYDFDGSGTRLLTVTISPAGTDVWRIVSVPDLETDVVYTGRSSWSYYGRFASDGETVWTTGLENTLVQWDARTSTHLRSFPAVGGGAPSDAGDLVLVPQPETSGAVLLDTAPPGELWSVASCGGLASTDRLRVTRDRVVVGRDCSGSGGGRLETLTLDGTPVDQWEGVSWEGLQVSPDGRFVVARGGATTTDETTQPVLEPLQVLDLSTGEVSLKLQGFCEHTLPDVLTSLDAEEPAAGRCQTFPATPFRFTAASIAWSPDGRYIAATGDGLAVWDAGTGELVAALAGPGSAERQRWGQPYDVLFSRDSERLLVTTTGRRLVQVDTAAWQPGPAVTLDAQNAFSAGLVGYAADGSLVVVTPLYQIAARTVIMLLDPESMRVRAQWAEVAEGSVQSAEVSRDGTRLALATSEGIVSVWDLDDRARVDQADPGLGRLDGVRWLDDQHLVVLGANGDLSTVTTDADELQDLARASLTRGLAEADCSSYRISPCQSLARLRGSRPVVPQELIGTYSVTWAPEEIRGVVLGWAEDSFGALDEGSVDRLTAESELVAGSYRLELREADYTITRGEAGAVWCTGSVSSSPGRPGRLVLGADSGERCTGFTYAEIGWSLDGDRLLLPADRYRGGDLDRLLWTSKPLERVG